MVSCAKLLLSQLPVSIQVRHFARTCQSKYISEAPVFTEFQGEYQAATRKSRKSPHYNGLLCSHRRWRSCQLFCPGAQGVQCLRLNCLGFQGIGFRARDTVHVLGGGGSTLGLSKENRKTHRQASTPQPRALSSETLKPQTKETRNTLNFGSKPSSNTQTKTCTLEKADVQ